MGKYLKLFENHNQYEAFTATTDFILPNVSHCIQQNDVHYNPLVKVNGVSLDVSTLELKKGATQTLAATISPADASYKGVTWSSSDETVATVSSEGLVTAVGDSGNATITVTTDDGGYTAQCGVSVKNNKVITYTATEKLPETTDALGAKNGLHINSFSGVDGRRLSIVSHTFENGVGVIRFDNDVLSVSNYAFYGCSGLTSIDMPNSITLFSTCAFRDCSGLSSIDIPSGVTSISGNAFYGCSSLTSITIPDSVTNIGPAIFQSCSSLTSCTIGSGVPGISENLFRDCSGLTSIDIPNNATMIYGHAFDGCSSLTSCTIGSGVTFMYNMVFNGCSSLSSITCNAITAPSIYNSTFSGIKTNGTLYVPMGSSGYDVWMRTSNYYLGKYNWRKVEQ